MANTATTGTSAAASELSAFAPELTVVDGQITTTSLQVAEHFGKRHDRVLRAIRNLIADLPVDHLPIFGEIQTDVDLGMGRTRQDPAFRLTRDGFTLLAMGFTGKEALQWKLAYLGAFNKMEAELVKLANTEPRIAYSVQPGDTLTAAQAEQLRLIFKDKCDTLPKEEQAAFMTKGWSKLKSHFGVTYRKIEQREFSEAISMATRHAAEWAVTPQLTMEPTPMPPKVPPEMLIGLISGGCLSEAVVRAIAIAANNYLFRNALASPAGYGEEVARKITHDLPLADLHAIVVRATMEMTLRVHGYDIGKGAAA